jgi:hypothetical protein
MSLAKLKSLFFSFKPKKSTFKYIGAAIALLGFGAVGTTFASNITLNTGAPVEFGQGVARTTACDSQVTITPYSTFINEVGAGSHLLTSIKVSGIDSSAGKCSGKTFAISAYGDSGLLNIFNYSDIANSVDQDFSSIEIVDNGGVFSWLSGGTDGDDLVNDNNVGDPGRDLTDTSFTISFTSNVPPISRTPLANAELVKNITIATYDAQLLSNRILTTSQIGLLTLSDSLEQGFDPSDALPGGNFTSTCDQSGITCAGYFTLRDWIAQIPNSDLDNLNSSLNTLGFTRTELSNYITFKFVYVSGRSVESQWELQIFVGGEILSLMGEEVYGSIRGFDGNDGFFIPQSMGPSTTLFFSVDSRLQSNSSIGLFTPYGDQISRVVPIRNFVAIWNHSDTPYSEETP